MNGVRRLCLILPILAVAAVAPAGAAPAATALPEMTARVIDQYVIPHFERLDAATRKLAADLDAGCGADPQRLRAARADFEAAVLAWAQVEFLRFGPMSVTGRPERFAFWPDPRGVTQRQLGALIARRDASALDPASLAAKSAAVQGLTVIEALLAEPGYPLDAGDEDGRYRCRLAVAVAQNLANISHDMLSEWRGPQGWRRRMLEPGPANASYRTAAEPPAEFARALVAGLQMIQDREVAPLIAAQPGKQPTVPFARSKLSAAYVGSAVASLRALYDAMGLANGVPKDKSWMPRWIAQAFTRLAKDGPAELQGSTGTKKDAERERRLRMLRFHVEGIRKLVGRELAPLAGLTIGFNELDGD